MFSFGQVKNLNNQKPTVNDLLGNYQERIKSERTILKLLEIKNKNDIIQRNTYSDLEIFKGLENTEDSLINTINKTKTISGSLFIKHILKQNAIANRLKLSTTFH